MKHDNTVKPKKKKEKTVEEKVIESKIKHINTRIDELYRKLKLLSEEITKLKKLHEGILESLDDIDSQINYIRHKIHEHEKDLNSVRT